MGYVSKVVPKLRILILMCAFQTKETFKSSENYLFLRNVGMYPLFDVNSLILKESWDRELHDLTNGIINPQNQ